MEFLVGYGSDVSDDEAPPFQPTTSSAAVPSAAPAVPAAAAAAGAVAAPAASPGRQHRLLPSLPQPQASASASLPVGFFDAGPAHTPNANGGRRGDGALPPAPGPAARPPRPAAVQSDLPAPDPALWAKLPEPAALPAASKRRVAFQSPLLAKAAALAAASDSDDDTARPAAKRAKVAANSGARHALTASLPAPKHDAAALASGGGGSGRGGGARLQTGTDASGARAPGDPGAPAPGPSRAGGDEGAGDAHAAAPAAYAADMYAVGAQARHVAPSGAAEAYAYAPAAAPPPQGPARAPAAAAPRPPPPGDAESVLAAALAEEAVRAAKRSGGGAGTAMLAQLQFKEVDGAQLKHVDAAVREANEGVRAALGGDYAQRLRGEAAPFTGNKMAKRKHQIGTLYANAKLQELEILEQRAAGSKSKAETKSKYGW